MPSQRLTDRSLRALKTEGQRVEVWDKTLPGFGVRVSETGRKVFIVRYRAGGKRRRVRVGRYAETSLADARDRARVLLGQVVGGDDPVRAHREGKTFGELAEFYLERYAKREKKEKSWREDQRQLEKDVLPTWRDRPASGITRADVHELLDRIADRAPVLANRTRALLSKVFNFGIERELVSANPVQGISRPTKERPRRRVLTDEEIRTLWEALVHEPPLIAASFKLRLITAQRGGEILTMRHEDIQGDEWIIPAEHFKSDRPHLVPLSPQAIAVLEEIGPMAQRSPWVFPSRGQAGHIQWLSTATMRIRKRTGFHWTPHDLRRTAATNMTKMGVPRFVVGRVLGHAVHDVTGVYDVYDYAAEKRDALESWGERVEETCRAKTEPKSEDTYRVLQPGGHGVGPGKFVGPYADTVKVIYENWAATERAKTEPKSEDTHRAAGLSGVGPMKRWSSAMVMADEKLCDEDEPLVEHFLERLNARPKVSSSCVAILEQYVRRGAPLGYYWSLLPPEILDIRTIVDFGSSAYVRQAYRHFDAVNNLLVRFQADEDRLVYGRWRRQLRCAEEKVKEAEERLAQAGLHVSAEGAVKGKASVGRKPQFEARAIVHVFRRMKPSYEKAWPDDRRVGQPTKNPDRLRRHIQTLLDPHLFLWPDVVENAINNHLRTADRR